MSDISASTEPRILRTQRVLDLRGVLPPDVLFVQLDEDDPANGPRTELYVRESLWRHLGSPDKLTVTIEPGDKLNEGEQPS